MAEDMLARWRRDEEKLNRDDAAAKAKGTMVGRYIQHPHADGYAYYKIVGTTSRSAQIEVIEIGDAWVLPAWGRKTNIPLAKARMMLNQRDTINEFHRRATDWWSQQTLGSIVHYDNGFGQYVRGEIIEHQGMKQMLPIALVGEWRPHDLGQRRADGSVYYGPQVNWILNKEPMQPHSSNMVECPTHRPSGAQAPSTLSPVSWEPSAPTPVQEALAALMRQVAAVQAVLNVSLGTDPEDNVKTVRTALDKARQLLTAA